MTNDFELAKLELDVLDEMSELGASPVDSEKLYEMANLQPRTTGLNYQLYATFNGEEEGLQHGLRVKVKTKNAGRFPIVIDNNTVYPFNKDGIYDRLEQEDVDIVDAAVEYIKKHIPEFKAHWDGKIGDEQLRRVLKRDISLIDAIKDAEDNGLE